MKKTINTLALVLTSAMLYAQTGVGTTSPQQQLHVAGTASSAQIATSGIYVVKPTIRIEGLNNTNNAVAKGSTSLVQPVDATQDGDFILSSNIIIPLVYNLPGTDAISATTTVTPTDTTFASTTLKTYTFTLNQTSMVHFLASLSTAVFGTDGKLANDNKNRICSTGFRFTSVPAGSGITLNTTFGSASVNHFNASAASGSTGATGVIYLQPESYLVLPPGSYTVILLGQAYGMSYAFNAVFGQAPDDMVSIVATPL